MKNAADANPHPRARPAPPPQAFGVSPKAVRDIWNRRTWRRATRPLWTPEVAHP